MIIHSTEKPAFTPGEVAMLRTFANQAALAMQRAGLVEQLSAQVRQLEAAQAGLAQKERLERELELARQVQQSVLPSHFPIVPGYQFAAHNQAARLVGGDFYDMVLLDDEHFGIAIADVSDKGMPAALFMALVRSLLRAEARRALSPVQVIRRVNELLFELGQPERSSSPPMFVTLFYGVVERSTHRLLFCRAGHDYPLLLRGRQAKPIGGRGQALGIFEGEQFEVREESLQLHPGDRLALYSDGLTDVFSPAGQVYGVERLTGLIGSCGDLAPEMICQTVFAELARFQDSAEQYDDMSLLVIGVE
jgi:sigma-B regulation protein RsbU (phosphoserine phosphatase)